MPGTTGPDPEWIRDFVLLRLEQRRIKERLRGLRGRIEESLEEPGAYRDAEGHELRAFAHERLVFRDPGRRDALLRRLGIWQDVSRFSPSLFRARFREDGALREALGGEVMRETAWEIRVRVTD